MQFTRARRTPILSIALLSCWFGLGCGNSESAPPEDVELPDLTFRAGATVAPGEELFRCIYAQVPADRGLVAVRGVESHGSAGTHHILVYRTDLTEVPYADLGVWDCADGPWFLLTQGSYYEAQQPRVTRELPAGIAHVFQPGEVMIIQSHFINTTDAEIDAHTELTLRTMDADDVQVEAGTIYFNNVDIYVPPYAAASTTMSCPLPEDIHLALLWSHMHERGRHFVVHTDDPAAAAALGSPLYEEHSWADPRAEVYRGALLRKGSRISFSCEYQNDGERAYRFGVSARADEMCILHGMYWPRTSRDSEQCLLGRTTMRNLTEVAAGAM